MSQDQKISRTVAQRGIQELLRRKYQNNLLLFAKEVLGYKDLEDYPHGEVAARLITGKKRKLFLLPRGSFKSTLITVAFPLWYACYNPNVRILIRSETYANAVKFLGTIKEHIEKNHELRAIYGILGAKNKSELWTNTEMTINTRTKTMPEPTFDCAGIDVAKVGRHYEFIIHDDLQSQMNTQTSEQIQKVVEDYKSS